LENDHFDDEQCLALLGRAQLGRIALSLRALPVVIPVRYTRDDEDLLFTASGEELSRALHGNIAALQADGYEEDSGQRWTVFAMGPVQRVEGVERLGMIARSLPWLPSTAMGEDGLFRLKPAVLSGRWMDPL
jgi:nitroimidazol reductase NimA-like FMN-containing flavoprotein (pyridoxamine 5'-phosphate oxidase superfamily)